MYEDTFLKRVAIQFLFIVIFKNILCHALLRLRDPKLIEMMHKGQSYDNNMHYVIQKRESDEERTNKEYTQT